MNTKKDFKNINIYLVFHQIKREYFIASTNSTLESVRQNIKYNLSIAKNKKNIFYQYTQDDIIHLKTSLIQRWSCKCEQNPCYNKECGLCLLNQIKIFNCLLSKVFIKPCKVDMSAKERKRKEKGKKSCGPAYMNCKQGKVYKLFNEEMKLYYIGSTGALDLEKRLKVHQYAMKNKNVGIYKNLSKEDAIKFKIILLEFCPCSCDTITCYKKACRLRLLSIEGKWQDQQNKNTDWRCLNTKTNSGLSRKDYEKMRSQKVERKEAQKAIRNRPDQKSKKSDYDKKVREDRKLAIESGDKEVIRKKAVYEAKRSAARKVKVTCEYCGKFFSKSYISAHKKRCYLNKN
jgi:hypothetical protein